MRRFTAIVGLVFAALTTSIPSPATAQGWTLDAYAGRAMYDQVSAGLGTSNGVLGIRYAGESGGWFFLSAAAPLQAADPFWAATGLGRRLSIGTTRFLAGADLGAHGHGYRDPTLEEFGAGATFSALPFVALAAADARVEMRSGLLQYTGTFSGETQSRLLHETGVRLILQAVPQAHANRRNEVYACRGGELPVRGRMGVGRSRRGRGLGVGRPLVLGITAGRFLECRGQPSAGPAFRALGLRTGRVIRSALLERFAAELERRREPPAREGCSSTVVDPGADRRRPGHHPDPARGGEGCALRRRRLHRMAAGRHGPVRRVLDRELRAGPRPLQLRLPHYGRGLVRPRVRTGAKARWLWRLRRHPHGTVTCTANMKSRQRTAQGQ
jgi:hypothetical protein